MKRLIIPVLIAMTLPACSTYIERDHKLVHIQDKKDTQVYDTQVYDTQVYDKDKQVYDTDSQVYDRSRSNTNNSNTVIRQQRPDALPNRILSMILTDIPRHTPVRSHKQ
jgi:hypothetical protein